MDNNLQFSGTITSALSANPSHHILYPSAGVPSGPPEVTVFVQHVRDTNEIEFLKMWCAPVFQVTCPSVACRDPNEIEFLGMWCAPVVQVTCPSVAVKHFTKRGIENRPK